MVICQSVFGALCTIKHTDLELYNAAISSFDMTGYIRIGSYQRDLITYHGGKSVCSASASCVYASKGTCHVIHMPYSRTSWFRTVHIQSGLYYP